MIYARASEKAESRSEIVYVAGPNTFVIPLTKGQAALIVTELLTNLWRVLCN